MAYQFCSKGIPGLIRAFYALKLMFTISESERHRVLLYLSQEPTCPTCGGLVRSRKLLWGL